MQQNVWAFYSAPGSQSSFQSLSRFSIRIIDYMEPQNHTEVSEFLLLGLTEDPEVQLIRFGLFLSMYLDTVLGNLCIILAVNSDHHLHTPMYSFLCNLSFTDICISTTTIPTMLVNIQAQNQHISFTGCITQEKKSAWDETENLPEPVLCFLYNEPLKQMRTTLMGASYELQIINNMKPTNLTDVSEFLLLGLIEDPELQPILFGLFLSMYLVTILGNLLIILAVGSDPHLHTPMYFFLSHLSFTDICISTTNIPKMRVNIKIHNQHISYTGCLLQMGLVTGFGEFESCLLAAMAYDNYVAICHPLMYTVIMNPHLCVLLILLSAHWHGECAAPQSDGAEAVFLHKQGNPPLLL
ncbi:Olfactory Receptor 7G2 [Manis pentadactyla]|nr:Olfactory Receptor 7G2 [Manis pentadactyla]